MPDLSILVPLRTDSFEFYRRRLVLRDNLDLAGVETIVIDDGSPPAAAGDIEAFCLERAYRYLRIESSGQEFSLARSRNAGLRASVAPWVYMEDADLIYCRHFFQDVIAQLNLLARTPFNFLTMPAVYLTAAASENVYAAGGLDAVYRHMLTGVMLEDAKGSPDNEVMESFSPASGVVALSRELALSVGGYEEAFSGWGGEDRDFIFRLLCANDKIQRPAKFGETKSWNLNDTLVYEGWRAMHRIHGEFMARQGFYAFHLHHEKLRWRSDFASARNMKLAAKRAAAFTATEAQPGERFNVRQSVLFDVFRHHDVLGSDESGVGYVESLNRVNRIRAKALGRPRRSLVGKVRKLFASPKDFFEDSKYSFFRLFARVFRKG